MRLRKLSGYRQRLYERGGEIAAGTVPTVNDTLGRLITLDTALIGGGFLIAKGDALPAWAAVVVLALLLVSLSAALFGIVPTVGVIDRGTVRGLDAIPAFEGRVVRKKWWSVVVAAAALVAGFAVGILGVAVKTLSAP